MNKLQSLRGMVDLLPQQIVLWQHIEAHARRHFGRAGVAEIRTPLLEHTELFARGIGEATDVVGKEMYTFVDRGERSCTLRPEGTASVVRAAIEHGLLSASSASCTWLKRSRLSGLRASARVGAPASRAWVSGCFESSTRNGLVWMRAWESASSWA